MRYYNIKRSDTVMGRVLLKQHLRGLVKAGAPKDEYLKGHCRQVGYTLCVLYGIEPHTNEKRIRK